MNSLCCPYAAREAGGVTTAHGRMSCGELSKFEFNSAQVSVSRPFVLPKGGCPSYYNTQVTVKSFKFLLRGGPGASAPHYLLNTEGNVLGNAVRQCPVLPASELLQSASHWSLLLGSEVRDGILHNCPLQRVSWPHTKVASCPPHRGGRPIGP